MARIFCLKRERKNMKDHTTRKGFQMRNGNFKRKTRNESTFLCSIYIWVMKVFIFFSGFIGILGFHP
jgi:hypothetical protein